MMWRTVVTITMVLAASVMFRGAGIILAITAAILWWIVPLAKAAFGIWDNQGGRPNWVRFALTASASFLAIVSLFTVVPWLGPYRAPAVVEFSRLEIVRAQSSGFVSAVLVMPGQMVRTGAELIRLDNPDLVRQLRELELSIERSDLKSRMLKREGKLAENQAERELIASLQLQHAEKSAEVAALTVRATRDGIVMGRHLAALPGTYLAKGDEILAIGEPDKKELLVSVAQQDVQWFNRRVGLELRIALGASGFLSGTLDRMEPQASTVPPHAALGADCGGPLPVAERRDRDDGQQERIHHELLTPRFVGVVPLAPLAAERHLSGQLGEVSFRAYQESFGEHLLLLAHRWLTAKLELLTRES
jgi:putative peptide zinc metalloprotease protein